LASVAGAIRSNEFAFPGCVRVMQGIKSAKLAAI
jgi:hypothetical protein